MLAARQNNEQGFRVMVKHAIHYTPLFGWYIFQHGYIYVRRFGDFVQTPVLRQLRWLNSLDDPYWLLIFPEGTRYIKKKAKLIESSQEFCRKNNLRPLENVLSPRVGGIQLAVEHLNSLDAIYDVTIAYGQERLPNRRGLAPGMFEFVCGPFEGREVHVHVKRYDIKEIPRDKDGLRNWIRQVYDEKDKLLDNFYTTGSYTEKVEEEGKSSEYSVENSVSIYRTLPPTLAFSAALIAPIFSQTARKAYLITIASFPLLICWLHVGVLEFERVLAAAIGQPDSVALSLRVRVELLELFLHFIIFILSHIDELVIAEVVFVLFGFQVVQSAVVSVFHGQKSH
ncbi:hypothetical protein WR25_03444 [Diploscapter pachys]|uniref:Phospholipid/glycerol acyltransferase domain-containing protein n=1 Tax=Diploscapter pachys TaxID=2018661 RepID=A0A2A2J7G2_9BILA|nr:hypothetical protein WR25_03444 [Diploscapter pachys]